MVGILWSILEDGVTISLAIDRYDNLVLKENGQTIARYNEKTEKWIGFNKSGNLIQYPMPSLRKIAGAFLE